MHRRAIFRRGRKFRQLRLRSRILGPGLRCPLRRPLPKGNRNDHGHHKDEQDGSDGAARGPVYPDASAFRWTGWERCLDRRGFSFSRKFLFRLSFRLHVLARPFARVYGHPDAASPSWGSVEHRDSPHSRIGDDDFADDGGPVPADSSELEETVFLGPAGCVERSEDRSKDNRYYAELSEF